MAVSTSVLAGIIFGVGLLVSGMSNPAKVLGFLDVAGHWDPSLVLVMSGAVAVNFVAFAVARKRTVSFLGLDMKLRSSRHIDRRLVLGSVLFGVGWGIAGLCPGPALVVLGTAQPKAVVFFAAMLGGMGAFEWLEQRKAIRAENAARSVQTG
ncbi:MAG: YeeE/YedE family protein [Betaproteobacteria bacterium]